MVINTARAATETLPRRTVARRLLADRHVTNPRPHMRAHGPNQRQTFNGQRSQSQPDLSHPNPPHAHRHTSP
jgi:hypothetical protein